MTLRKSGLSLRTLLPSWQRDRRRNLKTTLSAFESLEPRLLLSAAAQEFAISEVHLRVNGDRDIVLTDSYDKIELQLGDSLQVVGITYEYNPIADPHDGVVAFEGYLNRLNESGQSEIDYTSGRFGSPSTPSLVPGDVSHPGLDGAWTVADGDTRIVMSTVRYFGDQPAIEASFTVNLQVDSLTLNTSCWKVSRDRN